jgi:uridine phosphorylase
MPTQPHLLIDEQDVSSKAIVAGDPARIEYIASLLTQPQEVSRNRGYLVMRGFYKEKDITLCAHGVGSPSAAIAFTELWKCGVRETIRVGTCGALQNGIGRGGIIIATAAVREEHTSHAYVRATYPAVSDLDLVLRLRAAADHLGHPYHEGIVVTHDVYYQPDTSDYQYWNERGVLAIEMEVSSLLTLAGLQSRRAAAILVADGNILEDDQNLTGATDEHGHRVQHENRTRSAIESAVDIALEAI